MKHINLFLFILLSQLTFGQIDSLSYYYNANQLNKAINYGEYSIESIKDHQKSIELMNNLAFLYEKKSDLKKAEKLYKKTLEKISLIYDKKHLFYVLTLNNLGLMYKSSGLYKKAESMFLNAIEILKNTNSSDTTYFATSIINIADLYQLQGLFRQSEEFYLQSLEIDRQALGENSIDYAISLNNLGELYRKQEQFAKAEIKFLKVLEILKINNANNKSFHILNNLGLLYMDMGDLSKAETYMVQNLNLIKDNTIYDHFDRATLMNNLAMLYSKQSKFSSAEKMYSEALELLRIKNADKNPFYATTLNNLGILFRENKDYPKAETYLLQALQLRKLIVGEVHPDYLDITDNLAFLYEFYKPNNYKEKRSKYLLPGLTFFQKKVIEEANYLTQLELNLYRQNNFFMRFIPQSFLQTNPTQFPELNNGCYENELLLKNLSLRNQQRIKNSIEKSNDTALKEKYQQFISNKRYLNKLEELLITEKPAEYETLKTDTENLEKDITRLSSDFANAKKALSVTWKQIQEKLKPNEVAIDMVSYNYYNKKWTDSLVYGAFVIKKDSKFPKYITLFEQKQLENLLKRESDNKNVSRINIHYRSKAIADLFLKPVEQDLKDIKTIYLSPSGLGHQINFLALPVSASQTLGDAFQVHILGSTSEIVNYKTASLDKKSNLEIIFYGNIDYDKSDVAVKTTTDSLAVDNTEFASLTTRSANTDKYDYLKGTKVEINKINALAQQNNFKSTVIDDKIATEESIKLLDGKKTPFVLHLATHGFFFPDPKIDSSKNFNFDEKSKSNFYKMADDPMMRSGLLLAGANKFWGKPTENITTDDGILTANEISNLDLSSCQLVVMSACETGLGDINGSEGVFGLQRAFKMAGVKNIIMSLWKIDDEKTVEFFDIFYANCFSGKTIHEAFQLAQTQMKTKYTPYYWAGFILLE